VDIDPAVGNAASTMLHFTLNGNPFDSSNLGYIPGFDPNAPGEYSFELSQIGAFGVVDRVAINVQVGTTVTPEPAAMTLLGTGLFAVAGVVRRRKYARTS